MQNRESPNIKKDTGVPLDTPASFINVFTTLISLYRMDYELISPKYLDMTSLR